MSKGRILFIDLARGLAVLFMVMVHVLLEMCSESLIQSNFGKFIEFLGGPPAAPVFMFLMGTSMVFSKSNDLRKGIIRGTKIFLLGYILNFLRGSLPMLVGLKLGIISSSEMLPFTPLSLFFIVDILQFAGLALIILSILKKNDINPFGYLIIAIGISLISPLLWGKVTPLPILRQILTLFWGIGGELVAFPVFPWLFYPLCGMTFGYYLKKSEKLSQFMHKSLIWGIIGLVIATVFILFNYDFHVGDYWRSGPGGLVWIVSFILVFLWICYFLVKNLKSNQFFSALFFWSKNVTAFYFIHWIIIGWISFFQIESIPIAVFFIILISISTDLLTRLWNNIKQIQKRKEKV